MEDFTIKETYKLPSLGKIYDGVPEEVTIRSMTINEEMMRLGANGTWKSLAELLDACIVTKLPISTYDMCTADFTLLWHRLRVVTYGNEYSISCTCPSCGHQEDATVDLLELPITYYGEESKKYESFDLPVSGKHITLNIQTPHMLDAIDSRTKALKDRNPNQNAEIMYILQVAINTVDGERLDNTQKELLLRQLPMRDINKMIIALDKLNNSFGLGVKVDVVCDECGKNYSTIFRQGADFFRPTEDF